MIFYEIYNFIILNQKESIIKASSDSDEMVQITPSPNVSKERFLDSSSDLCDFRIRALN